MVECHVVREGISRRGVLAGLAAATLLPAAHIQARPLGEYPVLERGVNLSHWFAQSHNGYGQAHLSGFVSHDDLATLANAGFAHVRLPIEPAPLFANAGAALVETEFFRSLLSAIGRIQRHGLALVLDLHPVGAEKNSLSTVEGAQVFVDRWRMLATALVSVDLGDLTLELLNEPEPNRAAQWWDLQGKAIAAVRSAGATGWIIVNGGGWSGVDDLVVRSPYPDRKLVYTVHCYAPLLFTHQGATWTWDVARDIAGVEWPLTAARAAEASAQTQNERARGFLKSAIANSEFTVDALAQQFDRLQSWSEKNGSPPIYVGEFGVYSKVAPAAARLRWIETVRTHVEAHGWGWALWDASPSFGLRTSNAVSFSLDSTMLHALGLRAA